MRHFFLSVIGVLAALISYAQNQPKPQGYVVLASGDTVRGTVTIPQFATERGVTFYAPDKGAQQVLFPQDLLAFGVVGGPTYETRTLTLTQKASLNTKVLVNRETELRVFAKVLVRGFASLYQLDYHFAPDQGLLLGYVTPQTRFFLFSHPRLPRLHIQTEDNLHSNLHVLFDDCNAAQPQLSKARFEPNSLAALVLAYNACHPGTASTDLRPTANPNNRSVVTWQVRAGANAAFFNYQSGPTTAFRTGPSGEPTFSGQESPLTPSVGVMLRFAKVHSSVSFLLGVQAGQYRSVGRNTYTVPTGFYNAGQQLLLRNEVKLTSVQLPMLAQFSFRQPTARLRPFLQVGPAFDFHLKNRTTYQSITNGFDNGRYLASAQQNSADYKFNFAAAATASVGLSQQIGAHRLLADVNYALSRELSLNGTQGYVSGSVLGLRLGFEW